MKCLVTMGDGETKNSFFTPAVLQQLETLGEVIYNQTGKPHFTKQELIEHIRDVDVVFTGWGDLRIDRDVIAAATKLKIHAHTGGSVASYVSAEEYAAGVQVISGNDLFAKSVAEGCLCYTLTALRRMNTYISTVKNGGWMPAVHQTQGLIGKKVGLVGYGAIARYYAQLLQWFSPELLICSAHISQQELDLLGAKQATAQEIFETCDVISFHTALNDSTRELYTADLLRTIKDGALFVNTARAGIFKEQDLYAELQKNRFEAILDVYHEEPLAPDHILRTLPNVILLPHVAGPTFDMREKVVLQLIKDVQQLCDGKSVQSSISYAHALRMTVN